MRKVFSLILELYEVSGVQKVLLDIHNGIKDEFDAKVVGFFSYKEISLKMDIEEDEYLQIRSICDLRNGIVITHERKASTKCYLTNLLFRLKISLIHVQHSIYNDKRIFSLFPSKIVSISDAVTHNLTSYFKIPSQRIVKIHNGIIDKCPVISLNRSNEKIKIAYVARIDTNKQQLDIVKNLNNKLPPNIEINFVGCGNLLNELEDIIDSSNRFHCLGFRKDIIDIIKDSHYVMLFSKQEGLSISLIEGTMCGKPLIINNIGGNLEIGIPKINAFLANTWQELTDIIISLQKVSVEEYNIMSINSRKIYEEYFTYEMMISKYKTLIKQFI